MKTAPLTLALALAALASPAHARSTFETTAADGGIGSEFAPLQCVPYARDVSGIAIYGDAYTWWDQADGKYRRGTTPKIGAVMALKPNGNSHLGHVAAVSGILNSRTVLLRHANWSHPGMIEDNVRAVDVSTENDWSKVRIWYAPTQSLGSGEWPLYGFIYNEKPGERRSTPVNHFAPKLGRDFIGDVIAGRLR